MLYLLHFQAIHIVATRPPAGADELLSKPGGNTHVMVILVPKRIATHIDEHLGMMSPWGSWTRRSKRISSSDLRRRSQRKTEYSDRETYRFPWHVGNEHDCTNTFRSAESAIHHANIRCAVMPGFPCPDAIIYNLGRRTRQKKVRNATHVELLDLSLGGRFCPVFWEVLWTIYGSDPRPSGFSLVFSRRM